MEILLWVVVSWWSQSWLAWDDFHGQLSTKDETGSRPQIRLHSQQDLCLSTQGCSDFWFFFNNRNETATGRRKNNGVLTSGTKIGLGWPFRSERKWRHRKTDVGWPPCQEANIPGEVSTDLTNKLSGGYLDLAILLAIFWQKSTFSST